MTTDALLLEGLRQGDTASFEELFHRHYQRVFHLLFRLLGKREEAEDLSQEVFLRLHQRPLRRGDNVGGWLYRVATNLAYNAIRGDRRRRIREEAAIAEGPESQAAAGDTAEQRVMRDEIRSALLRLSPRQGQLLLLRELGLSYQELADALGIRPGSVGTLLVRAEQAFRRAYEGEIDE